MNKDQHKYAAKEKMNRLKKGIGKRVPVRRVRAFLAKAVQEKRMIVGKTHETSDRNARMEAAKITAVGHNTATMAQWANAAMKSHTALREGKQQENDQQQKSTTRATTERTTNH